MNSCRRLGCIFLTAAALGGLVGCSTQAPPARAAVVVLVDRSASVRKPEMIRLYERVFDAVAKQLAPGDVLLVAPITAASEMTLDLPINEELPAPAPPNDNPALVRKYREEAKKKVDERLPEIRNRFHTWMGESRRKKILTTDLLGALSYSGKLFASYPECKARVLVILSDMVQDSPAHSFAHGSLGPKTRRALLAALRKKGEIPRLAGVQVHVIGASAGTTTRFRHIRDFWLAYFKAAGATLKPNNYGAALVRFQIDRKSPR